MSRAAQQRFRLEATRRPSSRAPKPDDVLAVVESLPRDGHAVLASMDDPETYIQVWLRPDGSFQLELRDGSVGTHRQTRTISRERVAGAFSSWLAEQADGAGDEWRSAYQWNDISAQFDQPDA
ncbi:hypothetical protein GCM10027446_15340 [Angustibacter peucedani]